MCVCTQDCYMNVVGKQKRCTDREITETHLYINSHNQVRLHHKHNNTDIAQYILPTEA